jgi:hypothetical protein
MGAIGIPETSVLNQPKLRNNPEDGRIQLNPSGRLRSCTVLPVSHLEKRVDRSFRYKVEKLCVISLENVWGCSQVEPCPVLLLIQMLRVTCQSVMRWDNPNYWRWKTLLHRVGWFTVCGTAPLGNKLDLSRMAAWSVVMLISSLSCLLRPLCRLLTLLIRLAQRIVNQPLLDQEDKSSGPGCSIVTVLTEPY